MYRQLTREERTSLNRFFDKWGLFDYFKGKHLLVREGKVREIFMMTKDAKEFALNEDPYLAGIKLCELRKHISLSLEGAQIFAKNTNKKKIVITEQAESLVLYGRDVFGQSIIKHTNDFDENETVLIVNRYGEAICIGLTRYSADKMRKQGVVITNLSDLGWYLREETNFEMQVNTTR